MLSPRGQETAAADGSAPSGPLGRADVVWSQGCPAREMLHGTLPRQYLGPTGLCLEMSVASDAVSS